MGVKLNTLLDETKKIITYENLLGKKLAIDAFNTIYQFLSSIHGVDGSLLQDRQGNVTSHLSGLIARNVNLLEKDIKLIYVFDGKPNSLKAEEIERRKELRTIATKKFENAQDEGNQAEMQKYAKGTARITPEMVTESKELLGYMGIPVIQAIEDGEAQASYLIQKDMAWACGSQDYDAFLFGANRIVRNLSASQTHTAHGKTEQVSIEWFALQRSLEFLGISREQLVDMAILIGVDFFAGIKGIGEKSAYKYIKDYGNIETFLREKGDKHDTKALTPVFLETVRSIFLKPKTTDDFAIRFMPPQYEKISEMLVERHNFSPDRVNAMIKRLRNKFNIKTQSTLEKFGISKRDI